MPPVKPIDVIQERYSAASGMADRYTQGINVSPKSWKAETLAAEGAYKQGTAEAAAKGLFGKGVGRVSDEEWRSAAIEKGGARYSGGITAGVEKYIREVSPFLNVIKGITLPKKGARGSPGNYARVQAIGEKLHAARLARG